MDLVFKDSAYSAEWASAISMAYDMWVNKLGYDYDLEIDVYFDPDMSYLAKMGPNFVGIGAYEGDALTVTQWQAGLQGRNFVHSDAKLTINPSYNWGAGGFDKVTVMAHELGHALFMINAGVAKSPFELFAEDNAELFSGAHTVDPTDLMYYSIPTNTVRTISDDLLQIAGQSGVPTEFDDTIYLVSGAVVDGRGGIDTAIWTGSLDSFNCELINIERLIIDDLTERQEDVIDAYHLILGREADLGGLIYWDGRSDLDIDHIQIQFLYSQERADLGVGYQPPEDGYLLV